MKQAGYTTGSVGKWHIGLGDGHVDWNKEVHPGAALRSVTTIRLFRQQPMIAFLASFWKMEELSDWIRMTLFMWITGKTSPVNLPVKRTPNCCACIPVVGHAGSIVNGVPALVSRKVGRLHNGKMKKWQDYSWTRPGSL